MLSAVFKWLPPDARQARRCLRLRVHARQLGEELDHKDRQVASGRCLVLQRAVPHLRGHDALSERTRADIEMTGTCLQNRFWEADGQTREAALPGRRLEAIWSATRASVDILLAGRTHARAVFGGVAASTPLTRAFPGTSRPTTSILHIATATTATLRAQTLSTSSRTSACPTLASTADDRTGQRLSNNARTARRMAADAHN